MENIANVDQAKAWDGDEGAGWSAHQLRHDLLTERYPRSPDGAGRYRSVRACARHRLRHGANDSRRGADREVGHGTRRRSLLADARISAREMATSEGVTNVTFAQADAQVHEFTPGEFDIAISRFGSMFFGDPVAAFANIAGRARTERSHRVGVVAVTSPERVGFRVPRRDGGRPRVAGAAARRARARSRTRIPITSARS